jgi:peptidoglycan/LPS O-acetylase OafA/YrhL
VYFRFDTRASGLVLGALIAIAPFRLPWPRLALTASLLALLTVDLVARWLAPEFMLLGISVVELSAAVLILAVLSVPGLFAHPMIAFIGRMSYGMYLWHYPIMRAVRDDWHWSSTLIVGTLLSLMLAWISAVTIERWLRAPARGPVPGFAVENRL